MSKTKDEKLGMSHGAAANRLRKIILFDLLCRLKLDECYRCGEKITDIAALSIEHKEPWLQADDPVAAPID